jgi:hypothetical protein
MNTRGGIAIVCLVLVVLLMAGCAAAPTRLESTYGMAYHFARVAQTLDPGAAMSLEPVQEFDGKAAKHLLERYRSTFEKPPPPPSFLFSVGGIK